MRQFALLAVLMLFTAGAAPGMPLATSGRDPRPASRAPAGPSPALTPTLRRPEARVGPYRVLVEQVTASEYLQELLGIAAGARPAATGRRSAHLQLRLVGDTAESSAAVDLFAVHALTVEADGRAVEVAHYGGPLENADDAVLRAYVYAGDVGMSTREIRSVEGEITAFEHAEEVRAELPLEPGASVLANGARFTISECSTRDGMIGVRLLGRPPAGAQLLAAALDGTYGIDLLTESGTSATPAGSTLGTTADGDAEFDLAYQLRRGVARRLSIRALIRSGARHVYPFRIEHVPLPARPERGTH